MIIPIFPRLTPELAPRVGKALDKLRDKQISESDFVQFFSNMTSRIYEGVVPSPRVSSDFDRLLPPLIGKELCFVINGLNPWIIEIVPVPKVISIRLSNREEIDGLPGFCGESSIMKPILLGSVVAISILEAVRDNRLKLVNASESNPASWMRDLFTLVGPCMDRKDLVQKAIAQGMPTFNTDLNKIGC